MEKMINGFRILAGCHTRNNLEHLGNAAFYSFETAFFYLLDPYLLATLWKVNGCSQNIQDLLDMTNEKTAIYLHA